MSKTVFMRGLQNFISDIRGAQNKEQEQKRVEKELAKIRERFSDDKSLSGYDRRKYVWKLLYIYMLGYDIEFGHKQAADLIPLPKYKDKQVGYMACSLLLHENDEFLRLTMNAIHNDLTSRNEAFETLGLSFIGNVGGSEMAEALTQDVIKLLSSGSARPLVKKRASLALLRLIRKTPSEQQVVTADTFSPVINALLEERDLGLLLSAATLLQGICARNGSAGYEGAQPRLTRVLERLTILREKEVPAEYLYYGIPSPWLQCKCLRVLQFFPAPEAPAEHNLLNTILTSIIEGIGINDAAKNANPNKANALYSILFEAVALATQLDADGKLLTLAVSVLGKFLANKEANVKYLTLETLSRLALNADVLEAIRAHEATITAALKDPDVTIRKRAMDLLFTMCNAGNAEMVVAELLQYLVTADFALREELVLKVAILAEKFAPSVQWYVDVAMQLLEKAGDFVSEDIWHRVVQLVTNNAAMQPYAARNVAEVLKRGAAHESLVCTAAYILGEFGRLIAAEVPPAEQFKLLYAVFPPASQPTKGLLMTAFVKIYLMDPHNANLRVEVVGLFERYQKFMDMELQQRAVEYLRLAASPQAASAQYLLPMPKWEERESNLLKRLQEREGVDPDTGATTRRVTGGTVTAGDPAAAGSSTGAVNAGPRLIVGAPLPTTAAAVPSPQPSLDLLGGDALPASAANGAPLFANGQQASAAAPAKPSNPVDLLADLLSDAVVTPAVPVPGPAPAAAQPATNPFAAPVPVPVQQPVATAVPYGQPPAPYGQPAYPGAPPPAQYGAPQPGAWPGAYAPAVPTPQPSMPAAPVQQPGLAPSASFGGSDPFGAPAFGAPPPPVAPVPVAAPVAAPAPAGQFAPARPVGSIEQWYSNLLTKDKGILYEDQYLQVGLQSRYARGSGQLMLFLGNKHGEQPLANVALVPANLPANLQVSVAPGPGALAPKQQVQVAVSAAAAHPFTGTPSLLLSYVLAGMPVQQELKLPVAVHKFVVPEPTIPKETFFAEWKANSNPPNKVQEMLERTTPLTSPTIVAVMRSANLGVEHGYLDPSPYNEAGAGMFVYGPPGMEQSVLVMVRVEGNPQNMAQFRITASSPAPQVAVAVKELLVAQLRAAAA
uniref:Clathrin adaptor alpha/beta/gamma-adaptin appendage Ig-like subdomain domain-containing protein n=1 Tax=Chlamydomonas leiostraca TaxID=1034604 RepID=A0A7S0R8D3_9CHLO|mmetsp:Transcript_16471/g.41060  ORF Transcript_16471/g.41060 Transcript_16471/m.41060 type:complete len:1121 (+) Transcript_16471:175-3537(+)|eukprot:CAMPEP_0202868360 /NCGR_PEP_ID=MMETSP1391-20130828/10830_1 /ASSEMBLY_ACC=CAM_ASM_000867 /TAXON_ID=1034604 /ORGANISM="Chlamydomonas leiostraca, Strain SAG 11-49" /LENGTH=1120 /DNA_ID=CAMNT_0049548523 /DNA_START=175 /DNA_END=3537 /DNA_ORIENTATION=+